MKNNLSITGTSFCLVLVALAFDAVTVLMPTSLMPKIYVCIAVILPLYYYMIQTTIKYRGVRNTFFMLLFLSLFFYYGQHFVVIIDPGFYTQNDIGGILSRKIPDGYIVHASYIAVICMLILHAGFFTVKPKLISNSCNLSNGANHKAYDKTLITAGWIIFFIAIIPTIKYLVALFEMQLVYGYLGRRTMEEDENYLELLGVAQWQILLANLFLPSIYALLIGYRGQGKTKLVYVFLGIYMVLYLLTGSRFVILKAIVAVVLIQSIWVNPLKKYNLKKLAIIAVITAVVFSLGTTIRGYTEDSMDIEEATEGFALSGILGESGITFTSISNVIYCCPDKVDYFYGKSLLGSVLQCLPGFLRFGFFDHNVLSVSATFSPLYYGQGTEHGYGSSFIAEAYYNFGYLMFLFIFILGVLIGKLDKSLVKSYIKNSSFLFFVLVSISGELVYGVRNDLSNIPRIFLTTILPIVIIAFFLEPKRIANK